MVDDNEIEEIISSGLDIEDKTRKLLDRANENGGKDNIAVVIIEL